MSRLRCVILLEISTTVLCLWGQGDFYQVRREIRKAAEAKADVALLGRAAKLEDISGTAAARAYAAWAGALEKSAPVSPNIARRWNGGCWSLCGTVTMSGRLGSGSG